MKQLILMQQQKRSKTSKCFDNSTSCSSENAVVVVDAVYDAFVAAIGKVGGALVDNEAGIIKNLWPDGHLNRHAIAQDADKMIAALNLDVPEGTEFVVVPTTELALTIPFQAKN